MKRHWCGPECGWCESEAERRKAERDEDPGFADDYMDNRFEHEMEAMWP